MRGFFVPSSSGAFLLPVIPSADSVLDTILVCCFKFSFAVSLIPGEKSLVFSDAQVVVASDRAVVGCLLSWLGTFGKGA